MQSCRITVYGCVELRQNIFSRKRHAFLCLFTFTGRYVPLLMSEVIWNCPLRFRYTQKEEQSYWRYICDQYRAKCRWMSKLDKVVVPLDRNIEQQLNNLELGFDVLWKKLAHYGYHVPGPTRLGKMWKLLLSTDTRGIRETREIVMSRTSPRTFPSICC